MADEPTSVPKRVFNTFFNPFALSADDYIPISSTSPTANALGHAGGLLLGYGTSAALLRAFLNDVKRRDTIKTRERIRSHIAAASPTMSIDPDLGDDDLEQMLREAGTQGLLKEQGDDISSMPNSLSGTKEDESWLGKAWRTLWNSAETSDPLHLAAAIGAAGLGGYMGYKGVGNVYDDREKKQVSARIARLRNEIDRQLARELMVRNKESFDKTAKDPDDFIATKPTTENGVQRNPKKWYDKAYFSAASLYSLYALVAGALGYNFVKKFADKRDANRQDLKKIEEYAKRQAISRRAPQFVDVTGGAFDDVTEPPKLRKRKQTGSISMPAKGAIEEPGETVDPNDPVAALLGG